MPVGIQPNLGQINQQAGQILLNVRNDLAALANFNAYLQDLGADGLTAAPISMASDDAAKMLAVFGECAALAGIAAGQTYPTDGSVPALPHSFLADIVPFLAGN